MWEIVTAADKDQVLALPGKISFPLPLYIASKDVFVRLGNKTAGAQAGFSAPSMYMYNGLPDEKCTVNKVHSVKGHRNRQGGQINFSFLCRPTNCPTRRPSIPHSYVLIIPRPTKRFFSCLRRRIGEGRGRIPIVAAVAKEESGKHNGGGGDVEGKKP